jgi:hypothetical protein
MAMCAHVTVDSSADACGGRCRTQLILLAAAGNCGYVPPAAAAAAAADSRHSTSWCYYISC